MTDGSHLQPYWFRKGQSGNPNGRPRLDRTRGLIRDLYGHGGEFRTLTRQEMRQWQEIVISMDVEGLKKLASDNSAPAFAKGLAIGVLMDMKSGQTRTLDKINERLFGRPKIEANITTGPSFADFLKKNAEEEADE